VAHRGSVCAANWVRAVENQRLWWNLSVSTGTAFCQSRL
jgi:hypothetical protein